LRLPIDCGKGSVVWPCFGAFDRDPQALQSLNKFIQILFRLFNDLLWKRAARNFGQWTIGKFCELSAKVGSRESRVQRIAHNDFFQLIPFVATPYSCHNMSPAERE